HTSRYRRHAAPSLISSCLLLQPLPRSTLFPYTTLFRSGRPGGVPRVVVADLLEVAAVGVHDEDAAGLVQRPAEEDLLAVGRPGGDRKSTRLNSSHVKSSYAVFCLKKKKKTHRASLCRPA